MAPRFLGSDLTASRRTVLTSLAGVAGVGVLTACTSQPQGAPPSAPQSPAVASGSTPVKPPTGLFYGPWLRENSHFLDAAGASAVLVEFLDFECEGCGAVFPVIEELRKEFKGKLTYAIRYFPLDGHRNAVPAAHAVEAAARQGKLEPMYQTMYQRQKEWAEQQQPVTEMLKSFAQSVGLDVARWESDMASASVKDRVQADLKDATELQLKGTPSFFFNAKPLEPKSVEELRNAIAGAV